MNDEQPRRRAGDDSRITHSLIDPRTGPYSSIEEIRAEIEKIRQLPKTPERDFTIRQMLKWIEWQRLHPLPRDR